jgi:hypothetical protein
MMELVGGRELWLSILRRGEPVLRNVVYATYVPHYETVLGRLACRLGIWSPREHCELCQIDKFRHWKNKHNIIESKYCNSYCSYILATLGTLMDTINIKSQLIHRLPMVVKKTDSWLLQLSVLLIAIGSLNPAAGFTNSKQFLNKACGTLNVRFMVSVSVPK